MFIVVVISNAGLYDLVYTPLGVLQQPLHPIIVAFPYPTLFM